MIASNPEMLRIYRNFVAIEISFERDAQKETYMESRSRIKIRISER